MTGKPASVSVLSLAGCLMGLALPAVTPPVEAQPAAVSAGAMEPLFDFDIPAQPLAEALTRYAAIADRPALFASDMTVGRESAPVRRRYAAETALRLLLDGTGLAAEALDSELGRTFLLKPVPVPPAAPRAGLADLLGAGDYAGLAQACIVQALCADARTRPGRYSAVLRFRADAAGRPGCAAARFHRRCRADAAAAARADRVAAADGVTLEDRKLLVERVSGLGLMPAVEATGISPHTARERLKRFQEGGVQGLRDRSSRPGGHARTWTLLCTSASSSCVARACPCTALHHRRAQRVHSQRRHVP